MIAVTCEKKSQKDRHGEMPAGTEISVEKAREIRPRHFLRVDCGG